MSTNEEAAIRVGEVMQTGVASVSPELPVAALQEFLTAEEIGGAPVLDQNGALLGVVSKTDIVSYMTTDPTILSDEALRDVTVGEIMTEDVLTVEINELVEDVARKLVENCVHRAIVTDGEKIRGIVTTFDLLRVLY
jgi:CBS domain-containing protein